MAIYIVVCRTMDSAKQILGESSTKSHVSAKHVSNESSVRGQPKGSLVRQKTTGQPSVILRYLFSLHMAYFLKKR